MLRRFWRGFSVIFSASILMLLVQRIWHDARKVNALPEHVINRLKSMGLQHERMASSDDNSLLI